MLVSFPRGFSTGTSFRPSVSIRTAQVHQVTVRKMGDQMDTVPSAPDVEALASLMLGHCSSGLDGSAYLAKGPKGQIGYCSG